jgi:hypothetical protein
VDHARSAPDDLSARYEESGIQAGVDGRWIHLCNIQASPGNFPRGCPAHHLLLHDLPHLSRRVRRLREVFDDSEFAANPFGDMGPAALECSAKGCRNAAVYQLRWNNPKLHVADIRKTWLACEEHHDWLTDFLRARGFLREVTKLPSATGGEQAPTP